MINTSTLVSGFQNDTSIESSKKSMRSTCYYQSLADSEKQTVVTLDINQKAYKFGNRFSKFIQKKHVENKISKQLSYQIDSLKIPNKWQQAGVYPPNIESKNKAKSIATDIYKIFECIPVRIAPSIEEGVYLQYKNFEKRLEISIEIYNDLDVVAILDDSISIISSVDVTNQEYKKLFDKF